MGIKNSDINRYLYAEMLFGNAFSRPISNFLTLYGSLPTEEDESHFYKNISRLINGSRTYKVVQL